MRSLAGMCGKGSRRRRLGCAVRGQAMIEYLVVAGILLASMAMLSLFLLTFKQYGGRILAVAASEYP